MKPEFTIEQIRQFVNKGYTSVSARYVKAILQHYDEVVKNNAVLPHVSVSVAVEEILQPKYMNDTYTWKQVQDAIHQATES